MVPTAPGHPRHTEVDADPIGVNAELGRYTNFVNLLGWCALALPAGFASHGLPFGVTFIAPGARDAALARFGMRWQESVELPLGATSRGAASRAVRSASRRAGMRTDGSRSPCVSTMSGCAQSRRCAPRCRRPPKPRARTVRSRLFRAPTSHRAGLLRVPGRRRRGRVWLRPKVGLSRDPRRLGLALVADAGVESFSGSARTRRRVDITRWCCAPTWQLRAAAAPACRLVPTFNLSP